MAGMLVPVLLAGGGIVYVASQGTEKAPPLPGTPRPLAPSYGSTVQQAAQQMQTNNPPPPPRAAGGSATATGPWVGWTTLYTGPTSGSIGFAAQAAQRTADVGNSAVAQFQSNIASGWPASVPTGTDPAMQKKLDQAEAYLKEQWENGNEVAKGQAADKLNAEYKLDPPLTGHESWGDMLSVVAGAAATAGCLAYPATAIAAPLCGIVAAWLGKKFGDWLEKEWPAIEKWFQDRWSSIEGAANDAYDFFADAF